MANLPYLLLLLLNYLPFCYQSRLRFTNIICNDIDPTVSKFEVCTIKAVSPGISEISIYVKLLKVPVTDISLSLQVKRRNSLHLPTPYEFHIDACAFLRNKKRNPYADLVYEILGFKKYSNLNHTCPFNHDLILHKYRMDKNLENIFPIPNGEYTMISEWYSKKVKRANVSTSFEIY